MNDHLIGRLVIMASVSWFITLLMLAGNIVVVSSSSSSSKISSISSSSGSTFIQCEELDAELLCDGVYYVEKEDTIEPGSATFWIFIFICIFLVLFAGLMSGLTLGLLSLDSTSLSVLINGGTRTEQKYAKRILPLVKRHHLLLVTLLLANALCMEALPLFLDRLTSPIVAVVVSVTAVLFFGEVIPQAICSRYGLAIGANVQGLVWFIMGLFFVVAYPISKLLDWLLGTEHGTYYRRTELSELVKMHAVQTAANEEPLTMDEVNVIKGALDLSHKTVTHAMTPIERVFMVDYDQVLNEQLFNEILQHSHSRVPVYQHNIHNLVGVLMAKSLLGYRFEEEKPISQLPLKPMIFVSPDHQLYDILHTFETGSGHIAAIRKNSEDQEILGIITLEDVIEELINQEITDEGELDKRMAKRRRVILATTPATTPLATPAPLPSPQLTPGSMSPNWFLRKPSLPTRTYGASSVDDIETAALIQNV